MRNPNLKNPGRFARAAVMSSMIAASLFTTACGSDVTSFSLLSDENRFQQNTSSTNGKIDILWVVDNSGSMDSSQQAVADNFARFIELFQSKGYDYRIAVTTTDAYRVEFGASASVAKFRDGVSGRRTGVFVIDPSTPNLAQTFLTNIKQGINGNGDERAFQSFRAALDSSLNDEFNFPRPDAFFSVVIVSDEDDFSHDSSTSRGGQYSYAGLHTPASYAEYLDDLMGVTPDNRSTRYNVNSIAIFDQACKEDLERRYGGQKFGHRYLELSELTSGISGSICGDFGTTLSDISSKIVELRTQFYLDREPRPETIVVHIDGVSVPRVDEGAPAPWHGFRYHADTNSITFHGTYVPQSGSSIAVKFDPTTLK